MLSFFHHNLKPAARRRWATHVLLALIGCFPMLTAAVQSDRPPSPVSARRWAELVAHVLEEFQAGQRDAIGQIEGDFSTREIRVRRVNTTGEQWASRVLTEKELTTMDLSALARDLYGRGR